MPENDFTPQALMDKLIAGFEPLFESGHFPVTIILRFEGVGVKASAHREYSVFPHKTLHIEYRQVPALLWMLKTLHYQMDNYSPDGHLSFALDRDARKQFLSMGYEVE